jgi:lipopolysaccharide/colanic/teichoic acid biosynthesis glycosyltransferase
MIKRAFDLAFAIPSILLLSPVFFLIALAIKLDSPGPVFFRQRRVGRNFRPFTIYKFRTMVSNAPELGAPITVGEDARITRVGRLLRRTKLDELPQLINVIRGEMSFVGPRPEVPRYVELFQEDYREILRVRPGITDLASIEYRNEAEILGQSADPEEEYLRQVLPRKIAMAKQYLARHSLSQDVKVIVKTLQELAH